MHFFFNSVISTTLKISILDSLLIGAIGCIVLLPFFAKKGVKKVLFYFSVVLYSSFLFFLTIPIVLQPYPEDIVVKTKWALSEIIWNPLLSIKDIHSTVDFVKLIGGNLCLLMPISILSVIKNNRFSWKKALLILSSVSIGIEVLQFIGNVIIGYSYRTVELLDLILNVLGAMFCFILFNTIKNSFSRKGG